MITLGSKEPELLRVLVIGAGAAGLLMGQVSKKAGINVTVFEQDESAAARPRDWNFGLYWAQSRLEECLAPEQNALLDTVQTDPSFRRRKDFLLPVFNGLTGELMKEIPAPETFRLWRKAWLELAKTCRLVLMFVTGRDSSPSPLITDGGVTATFEDGTASTGDLLIGAEGAHSMTRDFLFQADPQAAAMQQVPTSCCVTLSTIGRDLALAARNIHPMFCYVIDAANQFTWVSLHDCTAPEPAEWVFLLLVSWPAVVVDGPEAARERVGEAEDADALCRPENNDRLVDMLHARSRHLMSPFGDMLRAVPRGTKSGRAGSLWPGDAAHAMTFHRGQGLGNAIADVAELQTHLRGMKAHTREELGRAENSLAVHNWEKFKESMVMVTGLTRGAAAESS
ncbi:hypothetical protein VTK26DRAFT_9515 [Humicola hyalothermophila]